MTDLEKEHWFKDYLGYWGAFVLLVSGQAGVTTYQLPESWPVFETFFIFFGAYLVLNAVVSVIIFLLTWPARRNFHFSRYVKIIISFAAVFFLSELISLIVPFFQDR